MNSEAQVPAAHTAVRRSYSDFDRLAVEVKGFGLEWLQLDRGPLRATIQQLQFPGSLLSRFRFSRSFHQRGTVPTGSWTFALIGMQSPHVGWGRDHATSSHLILFPRDDEFQFVSHPGFHGDTISVTEETLRSVAELSGQADPIAAFPGGQVIMGTDDGRLHALRQRLAEVHGQQSGGISHPSGDEEFELVSALIEALPNNAQGASSPPAQRTRRVALRKAVEFINANADEAPTIAEVCRASGASWRTLNYAFQEHFGVTPKRYLQARRLWGVRLQLRHADPRSSVSEVASLWGFWHMGKFAAEYQSFFGELPSETLTERCQARHSARS